MTGDRYRAGKRLWSADEDAALRQRYPDEPTAALAASLRRTVLSVYQRARLLGLLKSQAYLDSPHASRLRRGDQVGKRTQFQKGQTPFNKGLRRPGYATGRMKETWFKPGERRGVASQNWQPLGTIAVDREGYQRIKVREARKGEATGFGNTKAWPLLNRYLWTQAHGPIPPGHAVVFRDGNKANCTLDNLELVSQAELMRRNSVHRLPAPVAQVIHLIGAVKRQLRRRDHAPHD